jgi:hypothetical protein
MQIRLPLMVVLPLGRVNSPGSFLNPFHPFIAALKTAHHRAETL